MAEKIRVLQVINGVRPGGAETFFIRLMKALHHEDWGIDVLPVVRAGGWVAGQLAEAGIPFETAPFGGFFDRTTKRELNRIINDWQPQIIQSWMNRATKFVPDVAIPKVARLGGYYNLRYYRKMDHLVGNTQDICKYLKDQGWPAERVHYLPNFTEEPPQDFKQDRETVRERYGIGPDKCVVLLAGRLHENKGFDLALYALRELPEQVHYLIAGEGPQKAMLEAMVDADKLQDRVTFAGWVPQVTPLAGAADIWLAPSRIEPLGNIVLDAWAHQVPIVASEAAGPRSLITEGENGLLVPLEDDAAIVAAVTRLVESEALRKKMATKGLATFREKFTPAVVIDQYRAFYRRLIQPTVEG